MLKRRLTVILGLVLVVAGVIVKNKLSAMRESPTRNAAGVGARAVDVAVVHNGTVAITVPITGRVRTERRMLVNAEVAGTLRPTPKPFRDGVSFRRGELLAHIDDAEVRSQVLAQKSAFLRTLVQLVPDLKYDLPEVTTRWEDFLGRVSLEAPLPDLPTPLAPKERNYLAARGILDQYYTVKAQEERLARYRITAPFDGQVTGANADPGTIVTPGTRLGELVGTGDFELEAGVPAAEARLLQVGDSVELRGTDGSGQWTGRIGRISEAIDPGTQTYRVFVDVAGKGLADGLYLDGAIHAGTVNEALALPRHAVHEEGRVYLVQDSALTWADVEVVHAGRERAVVRGLQEGQQVLTERLSAAHPGMRVAPRNGGR